MSNPFTIEALIDERANSLNCFALGAEKSHVKALMELAFSQGRLFASHERYERATGEQYQLDAIADSSPRWRSQ